MAKFIRPSDLRLTVFSFQLLLDRSMRLLAKRDITIFRKLYSWLFGRSDEESRYEPGAVLPFVVEWLEKALQDNLDRSVALRVMLNFMSDHQNMASCVFEQVGWLVLRTAASESEDN